MVHKELIIGGIMELFRFTLIAGFLSASLAGCTYSDPASEAGSRRTESPAPSRSSPAPGPTTLEGTFKSQGAMTSGSVSIRVTDSQSAMASVDTVGE